MRAKKRATPTETKAARKRLEHLRNAQRGDKVKDKNGEEVTIHVTDRFRLEVYVANEAGSSSSYRIIPYDELTVPGTFMFAGVRCCVRGCSQII